jgi:dihydrofolate reductase
MISIIVAAPWRLSDDLRRFKETTMGKPIIMGRKTWESIGRPLPGRLNIVITRQPDFAAAGCEVVRSVGDAIAAAGDADEIMIIGGSQVYQRALPLADRLYLTRVHTEIEGDAFFPDVDKKTWMLVSDERHAADERNEFDYSFRVYQRTGRS